VEGGRSQRHLRSVVCVLLLTGQRLDKVENMKWDDVAVDGAWTMATESRENGNAGVVALLGMVVDIIRTLPRFESNPYVFAGRGDSHFSGFSKGKAALDAKVRIPHWTLHDLRRTARSLMSRAGVRPDVAERTLGHVMSGVEGV
jgi:integrase